MASYPIGPVLSRLSTSTLLLAPSSGLQPMLLSCLQPMLSAFYILNSTLSGQDGREKKGWRRGNLTTGIIITNFNMVKLRRR